MNRQRYSLSPVGPAAPSNPPNLENKDAARVFPVAERPEDYLYKAAVERAFSTKQPEPDPLFELVWGNGG